MVFGWSLHSTAVGRPWQWLRCLRESSVFVGASLLCNLGYIPRYFRQSTSMPSKKLYEIYLRRAFVVRSGENFYFGVALVHSNTLYSFDFLSFILVQL